MTPSSMPSRGILPRPTSKYSVGKTKTLFRTDKQKQIFNVHLQKSNEDTFLEQLNSLDKDSLTNLCIAGDFNNEVKNPQQGNSKWKKFNLTNLWSSTTFPEFTHRKGKGKGRCVNHFLCNGEWKETKPKRGRRGELLHSLILESCILKAISSPLLQPNGLSHREKFNTLRVSKRTFLFSKKKN